MLKGQSPADGEAWLSLSYRCHSLAASSSLKRLGWDTRPGQLHSSDSKEDEGADFWKTFWQSLNQATKVQKKNSSRSRPLQTRRWLTKNKRYSTSMNFLPPCSNLLLTGMFLTHYDVSVNLTAVKIQCRWCTGVLLTGDFSEFSEVSAESFHCGDWRSSVFFSHLFINFI